MARKIRLQDALEEFYAARRANDISEATIHSNRMVMNRFLTVNGNLWVYDIDEPHVARHLEEAKLHRSKASTNLDRAVLRAFFKWARSRGYMVSTREPMYNFRDVKFSRTEKFRIPRKDFELLCDAAKDERDRIVIATGLGLCLRQGEMKPLRIKDMVEQQRRMRVVAGKTNEDEHFMYMNDWYWPYVQEWLKFYPRMLKRPLQPYDHFIPGVWAHKPYRDPHTGQWVRGRVGTYRPETPIWRPERCAQEAMERIGYPCREPDLLGPDGKVLVKGRSLYEGAHTLRRSGARAVYDRMVKLGYADALERVMALLHHTKRETTMHYIGIKSMRVLLDDYMENEDMFGPADEATDFNATVTELRRVPQSA